MLGREAAKRGVLVVLPDKTKTHSCLINTLQNTAKSMFTFPGIKVSQKPDTFMPHKHYVYFQEKCVVFMRHKCISEVRYIYA